MELATPWDGLLLILLAPSPSALRLMLNLCECFASSYGLKFNASKTAHLFWPNNNIMCKARIVFCSEQLVFSNVCHLCHTNEHQHINTFIATTASLISHVLGLPLHIGLQNVYRCRDGS